MRAAPARRARILIVDDHPIVREGLRARIGLQHDMEVCGEAAEARDALRAAHELKPDLAIVDIALGDSSGLDLIRQLGARQPDLRMLALSAHDDSVYAERALKAGAHGYISKGQAQGSILHALRVVLEGGCYLNPELNRFLIARALGRSAPPATASMVGALSNRELQVFDLIGRGRNTKSIAAELHLSPHTIDRHRENIKAKLGLRNALELQRAALQWALAPDGGSVR